MDDGGNIAWRLDDVHQQEQFWQRTWTTMAARDSRLTCLTELEDIVTAPSNSHELIDNALRAYLALAATYKRKRMG